MLRIKKDGPVNRGVCGFFLASHSRFQETAPAIPTNPKTWIVKPKEALSLKI